MEQREALTGLRGSWPTSQIRGGGRRGAAGGGFGRQSLAIRRGLKKPTTSYHGQTTVEAFPTKTRKKLRRKKKDHSFPPFPKTKIAILPWPRCMASIPRASSSLIITT